MCTKLLQVDMIRVLIVVNQIRSPPRRTHLHRFSLPWRRGKIAPGPRFGNMLFPADGHWPGNCAELSWA